MERGSDGDIQRPKWDPLLLRTQELSGVLDLGQSGQEGTRLDHPEGQCQLEWKVQGVAQYQICSLLPEGCVALSYKYRKM